MDHAQRRRLFSENAFGVFVGIASVDNDRQSELFRKPKLLPEYFTLNVPRRVVVEVV